MRLKKITSIDMQKLQDAAVDFKDLTDGGIKVEYKEHVFYIPKKALPLRLSEGRYIQWFEPERKV